MDCEKIGKLIARLRIEQGLTQQNIADELNISNKTVSKWECGLGCPDISLMPDLSNILGTDINQLISGEIESNKLDVGNLKKIRFYVCPYCKNILFSTGEASIFCCGKKLDPLEVQYGKTNYLSIDVRIVDMDYFVDMDHEMTREHHILFVAYVKDDKVFLCRLYPEQSASVRIPYMRKGKLYIYCTKHGLYEKDIDLKLN